MSGRFRPLHQLTSVAEPLIEDIEHPLVPMRHADPMPGGEYLLLVTEEDTSLDTVLDRAPAGVIGHLATDRRSPLPIGSSAAAFAKGAVADAMIRTGGTAPEGCTAWADNMIEAAQKAGVTSIVTAYAPVGPVRDALRDARDALAQAGITLHEVRRPYDDSAGPHATKGFFALKKRIPAILRARGLAP